MEAPKSQNARQLLHGETLTPKREFSFARESVDVEKRTVALSFSSEFPVKRHDFSGREFFEVLDHENVDMSRLKDGAPLLYGHDRRDHLGVVDAAAIGPDKKGRAIVRFSRSGFAQEKFQDVQDGILTKTSVGYDLGGADYTVEGEREGIPVYRFRNWQPYEVTLTPIPADPTVGKGRSQPSNQIPPMAEPAAPAAAPQAPQVNETELRNAGMNAERNRTKAIRAAAEVLLTNKVGNADDVRSLANRACDEGMTEAQFNSEALRLLSSAPATPAPEQKRASLGLNGKERKRYSLLRAIQRKMNNQPLDGFERECSDEIAGQLERQPAGFFVPDDIIVGGKRDLLATGAPDAGGYTISEELLTSEFVEYLRNASRVVELGARVITGLRGNVTIPRQLTGATAYWVSETGSITESNATFGQITARPRRVGTTVDYSKQFLAQSSLSAEGFIRNDSQEAIAVELDRVAINGAGGAEPLGLLQLASGDISGTITFGGAATWEDYVQMMVELQESNALLGTPGYLTTPASAAKAMTIPKFSNTATPIWDNDMIGTFRARWSNQFPSSGTLNQVIFGDFSQVIYCEWAGYDVVVDPYTGAKSGLVSVTIQRLIDMVIRRGKSFTRSTDSGAQ